MKNTFRWLLVLVLLAIPVLTVAARGPREPRNIRTCDPDTIHSLRQLVWYATNCQRGPTATPNSGELVVFPTATEALPPTPNWCCRFQWDTCSCRGYPCPEDYTTTPGMPTMTPRYWSSPTPVGWTASPMPIAPTRTPSPTGLFDAVCTQPLPYPWATPHFYACTVTPTPSSTPVGWTASPTITPYATVCNRGGCYRYYATDTPAGWTASPTMTWTPRPTHTPTSTPTYTPFAYLPPEDRPTATPYNPYP